jgi:crossover junction endodeoxyribonuclease RuvC
VVNNAPTRIIGLDPGLRFTGWGIIESAGNSLRPIACGVIKPITTEDLAKRLAELNREISKIIEAYAPEEAAVEETFVNKNPVSTLKLGMARGVVLATPALFNLPVFEYSANKVKKSVVGVGHAEKHQVITMVQRLLPTLGGSLTSDAADALAVAICHAHHRTIAGSILDGR